jgi:hypothetical protein
VTRKSRREVERGINDLRDGGDRASSGIIIGYEREDGTLTDGDGDPIPKEDLNRAGLVIVYDSEE